MGRNNKKYQKTMHQQIYDRLTSLLAIGESKYKAKQDGTIADKIFSYNTYKTYYKHCKYFETWLHETHPDVTTLKKARSYVNEWLQLRCDQVDSKGRKLSAYTITTETAALSKLFGIRPDDPDRFQPPIRRREDIRRSRTASSMDKHFSRSNNAELINFERGTGLRRQGLSSLTGDCIYDKARIKAEIRQIEAKPVDERTAAEKKLLPALIETEIYKTKDIEHFVRTKEKGGRVRLAPVLPAYHDAIVDRMKKTPPGQKVWNHVSKNYDVHADRAEYCKDIYRLFARPIEDIPYDAVNKGSGKRYQSEVYVCRKDEAGRKLDKTAMMVASRAIGHIRNDIISGNYLYGL